eukprot:TRINITY_DN1033_c2_g1_i1.p1 TRINITY_DN1033_c2_g1~~TRINITY_DN1033_c2_g1_i1.p1  ORF type:complete len:72 (-),score=8.90 TRINITY_DN1033_c2_g1_i1:89-304(-)
MWSRDILVKISTMYEVVPEFGKKMFVLQCISIGSLRIDRNISEESKMYIVMEKTLSPEIDYENLLSFFILR